MGYQIASLWALLLALTLSSAYEVRTGRIRNHGHYVCSTWGNFHYKTFDGDFYQFPGTCSYNLASDCQDSYKEFSVHVQRSIDSGHPLIDKIIISIKDVVIQLKNSLVVVNGVIAKTPYYSYGILIHKNNDYIKLYAKMGLTLMWNQEDAVMLELDSKFNNQTCGLCGDYNGVPVYNEFLTGEILLSPVQFGNLQNVHDPNDHCSDPDETKIADTTHCSHYRSVCEEHLGHSAFSDCQTLLNVEFYIQACMLDMCSCGRSQDSFCLCSTITEFSRQCSHAGGRPGNWRTDHFCPKQCPGNMIYQESASPCMNSCSHLEIHSLCEEHYMDGCFCPQGTVQDDRTGKGCVPVSECHCKHQGTLYAPGETIQNDCDECRCVSGRWNCSNRSCPRVCSIEGGAHFKTFDGKKYTFHGNCHYVLSKGRKNESHAILGELTPCSSYERETCLKTIILLTDNMKNVVTFKTDGTVLLNELKVTLPHVTASFSIVQPSDSYIIVQATFGLQLQIQLLPMMQLYINMEKPDRRHLQGLCGNFNYREGDDFKTSGGLVEATASAFANTWKAQPSCQDQSEYLDDPCSLSIESKNYAEYWCALLEKQESPFAKCHSTVDPVEYAKRCRYDACNCKDSEACMCAALSSYVRACAAKGIILWGWRKGVCDKDITSCPSTQIYLYNLTTCQPTCRSLAEGEKACSSNFSPVDGCGCPDGEYLNEKDQCVPISQCSCYYRGTYIKPMEVLYKQDERCYCHNGKLLCTTHVNETCSSGKVYFDCNKVHLESTKTPVHKSCQTLNVDYFQTECISGCVCPSGLLDDGHGGCVPEDRCPCVHNEDLFSHGSKVKVDCNTCVCKSGRWSCSNAVCYGTCTIYGNGHYITFDDKFYDFDGNCEFVAAQDYCGPHNNHGNFSIITENIPCGTTGVTCSKAIKVFLGSTELKLADKHLEETQGEVQKRVKYLTREVGMYLVIEARNGILLIWDRKTTIIIKVSPAYKGKVCGLCGNFDDNSNNDLTTSHMLQVTNVLEFGNSWKVNPTCPDVAEEIHPCSLNPHRKAWAEKQCGLIKSSVFKVCHSKVDPTPFYEACVNDACSCDTGGDCECFCTAVAAYAQECTKAGACVNWRTPDICPVFCDYYNPKDECEWHYHPCGNHSIQTCRSIHNIYTNITITYLEGCYPTCPPERPIFDETKKLCVKEEQCGCYINNTHFDNGENVPTNESCKTCVCTSEAKVECEYDLSACYCIINGTRYNESDIISTEEQSGICIVVTCTNGTATPNISLCASTTSIATTTTSVTTTTKTVLPSTVTTTTPLPSTTCVYEWVCHWSQWFDVNKPGEGLDSGDYEIYEDIRQHGYDICQAPEDIQCRAVSAPELSLEQLGQTVHCNVSYGLICKNSEQKQDQSLWQKCFNYEIRVSCCSWECASATSAPTTTTTISTTTASTTEVSTTTPPTPPSTPTTTEMSTTTTTTSPSTPPPTTTTEMSTTTPTISPSTSTQTTTPTTTTEMSTTSPATPPSTTTQFTTTEITSSITPTPFVTSTSTLTTTPETTTRTLETTTTLTTSPPSTTTITESTTTAACIPGIICDWSEWFDVSYPNLEPEGGDFEIYDLIRKEGHTICEKPENISCRAQKYPNTPIEDLVQKVTCDVNFGLTCYNKDQEGLELMPICDNYQIRVYCCNMISCSTTASTSTQSTTVTETLSTTSAPTTHSITTVSTTEVLTTTPCTTEEPEETTPETITTISPKPSTRSTTESTTTQETTTKPTTITSETTTCVPKCWWTEWISVSYPKYEANGGDYETYENIRKEGHELCEKPLNISCRAERFPEIPLEDLGQKVTCDVSYGLICNNKDQEGFMPVCYNYEISVYCCDPICSTTTPQSTTSTAPTSTTPLPTTTSITETTTSITESTTTPVSTTPTITILSPTSPTSTPISTTTKTPGTTTLISTTCVPTCWWTEWISVSYPKYEANGGDYETYENIRKEGHELCEKPLNISCRAERFPEIPLEDLGQKVTCDVSYGLICNNKDQEGFMPVCYNYEISVYCCDPICSTTTPQSTTPSTTTPLPTTTSITESTTSITESTTTPVSTTTPTTTTILTSTSPTSTPIATTTKSPETTTVIPTPCVPTCWWTEWISVSYPKYEANGGDYETYENIRKEGHELCEKPLNISCRAERFPEIPLEDLGQKVTCDVSYGLICNNKDQEGFMPVCYNYEISVYCCDPICSTTTPQSTTLSTTTPLPTTTSITESTTSITESTTTPVSTTTPTTTTVLTSTSPTSTPVPTTTKSPGTTTVIPTPCVPTCWWTEWISVSYPKYEANGGDYETYENIRKEGHELCEKPLNISCRAERFPEIPLEDLGQKVTCDVSYGLICNNKDQEGFMPVCYNYEISVYCCDPICSTTTPQSTTLSTTTPLPTTTSITESTTSITESTTTPVSTTTPTTTTVLTSTSPTSTPVPTTTKSPGTTTVIPTPCVPTCWWTEWISVSYPKYEANGGDYETYENIRKEGHELCEKPLNISCRAERFPEIPLEDLGQKVTCDVSYGLICNNKDQEGFMPVCYNYEISVYCCDPICSTTTPQSTTPSTTTPLPTTTSITESTTSITESTTTPVSTTTPTTTTVLTSTSPTSTPIATTTKSPETTTVIPTPCVPTCWWTEWISVSYPKYEANGGDYETYENIRKEGHELCEKPLNISCRAERFPEIPLEDLGQKVTCDVSYGLICNNKDQEGFMPVCYNYEISVYCCDPICSTTTPQSTTPSTTTPLPTTTSITETTTSITESTTTPVSTTTPTTTTILTSTSPTSTPVATTTKSPGTTTVIPTTCVPTCWWTEWISVSYPKYEANGGDYETYENIRKEGHELCEKPLNISCRAERFPEIPLEDLGQKLTCDVSYGLICNNKDQEGFMPVCYNYEISVYCCDPICSTTTPQSTTPSSTTPLPTTTSITETTTSITENTTTPVYTTTPTTTIPSSTSPTSTPIATTTKTPGTTTFIPTETTTSTTEIPSTTLTTIPTTSTMFPSSPTTYISTVTPTESTTSPVSTTTEIPTSTPKSTTPTTSVTTAPTTTIKIHTISTSTVTPNSQVLNTTTAQSSTTSIIPTPTTPSSSATSTITETTTIYTPTESTTTTPTTTTEITTKFTPTETPTTSTPTSETTTPIHSTTTTSVTTTETITTLSTSVQTTTPLSTTTQSSTVTTSPTTTTEITSTGTSVPTTTKVTPTETVAPTTTICTTEEPPDTSPVFSSTTVVSTTSVASSSSGVSTKETTATSPTTPTTTETTISSSTTCVCLYYGKPYLPGHEITSGVANETWCYKVKCSMECEIHIYHWHCKSSTTTPISTTTPETTTTPGSTPTTQTTTPTESTTTPGSSTTTQTIPPTESTTTPGSSTTTQTTPPTESTTIPGSTSTTQTTPHTESTTTPGSTTTTQRTPPTTTPGSTTTTQTTPPTESTTTPRSTTTTQTIPPTESTTTPGSTTTTQTTPPTESTTTPGSTTTTQTTPPTEGTTTPGSTTTSQTTPPTESTTTPGSTTTTQTSPLTESTTTPGSTTTTQTTPPTESTTSQGSSTTTQTATPTRSITTPRSTTTTQTTPPTESSTTPGSTTTTQTTPPTESTTTEGSTTTTQTTPPTESTTSQGSSTTTQTATPTGSTTTPGSTTTTQTTPPTESSTTPGSTTTTQTTPPTESTTTAGSTTTTQTTPLTESTTTPGSTTTTQTTPPTESTTTPGSTTTTQTTPPTESTTTPRSTTTTQTTPLTESTTTPGSTTTTQTTPPTESTTTPGSTTTTQTTPPTESTTTPGSTTTTQTTPPTESTTTPGSTTTTQTTPPTESTTIPGSTTTTQTTPPTESSTTSPTTTSQQTSTTSQTTSKTPTTTTTMVPTTTKLPGCPFEPHREHNETWILCNCTMARCLENNTVEIIELKCEPPPKITCASGYEPVIVPDDDLCCWHWECDCVCSGWGDPHYVTFDGTYYSYQGNCTYVLVEEIDKKVEDFGIYIDNFYCGDRDRVSCPRNIIVRHESQEIQILAKSIQPVNLQVVVNGHVVGLPYTKYGVKVYRSGVNYVVEIPELEANITFNGVSFSVKLPYRLFGHNTQGQCGTCTNNRSDDCMMRNGTITSNCVAMADSWIVHDPRKPECTSHLMSTIPPRSTLPSTPCKPSPLCELIKGTTFQNCHETLSPDDFYQACIFDSCHIPNSNIECTSLQHYALLCADQGICIEWRSKASACSISCPTHMVYNACGPAVPVTCQTTQEEESLLRENNRLVEGCFCPSGSMLFSSAVDVCVETCGCVGPDNKPRKFGEIFEFDCQDCICLEGGSGIVCQTHVCKRMESVNCELEGFYPVIQRSSTDQCCNETVCKCDTGLCSRRSQDCGLGFETIGRIPEGHCCPVYECVQKRVCVHGNAEYLPGSPVYSDSCQSCVCTEGGESATGLQIKCEHVPCNVECPVGFELKPSARDCCGVCEQTHCVLNLDKTPQLMNNGDVLPAKNDNCTIYSCNVIRKQFITSVSKISCPPFYEEDCEPGTIQFLPNGCCKICIEKTSSCKVQEFYDYLRHNNCRSVEKVKMSRCDGSCSTYSMYSAAARSISHKCTCCQEVQTSRKSIKLQCSDGSFVEHEYIDVEQCDCVNTECGNKSTEVATRERRALRKGRQLNDNH